MSEDPLVDLRTSRIEALCDGVFAIAMTILVLSIAVPTATSVKPAQLPQALRHLGPQVFVYAISFVNLGVLWVGQHNQYHFIRRADRWFIWINIGYLMTISFIPLSTALLGQYPLSRIALEAYGANIIVATLMLLLHWWYATSNLRLVSGNLPGQVVRLAHRRIVLSGSAYVCAVLISLASPVASLIVFFVIPFINVFPFRLDRLLGTKEP